jgi:glycine cleavage system H lipoate-binding protein
MFPGVHGFHWSPIHVIFVGAFLLVLATILVTLSMSLWRLLTDFRRNRIEPIRWHSDFEDLPEADRRCRHELQGIINRRTCPNGFDCRKCELHPALESKGLTACAQSAPVDLGILLPTDRYYHRGHTWAKPEMDGTITIGLDDLARRMIGTPEQVILPQEGERLQTNAPAWRMQTAGTEIRILSPVDGEVVARGGPMEGWYLRIRPASPQVNLSHLLAGTEVSHWMRREMERLQIVLTPQGMAPSLADGGVPVENMPKAHPKADWDNVLGRMFLEP